MQAAQFSSTRTPSTLTSVLNRSTFMTQGEACKIKSLKENRDGFYKMFFHVPHFVDPQPVVRNSLLCCPCVSGNIYAKKKGIAKKLILTLCAIMICQEVDLVAGDCDGTAWRCRSLDNFITIDEAFADCLWGPGSIPNSCADVCGFLKPKHVRLTTAAEHNLPSDKKTSGML